MSERRPRAQRHLRPLVVLALAATLVSSVSVARHAAAAPDFSSVRRSTPYARLFTQMDHPWQIRQINELSGAALDDRLSELTSWYVHFHAEASNQFAFGTVGQGNSPTTLAAKLSERGAMVSNYRNGSYVSQSSASYPVNFGEAADIEATAPLAIATFWPGAYAPGTVETTTSTAARLTGAVTADATTVHVRAATNRPAGVPGTWPYVNSRGAGLSGVHSTNTRDFVSWIRVDDELMKIVSEPTITNGVVTLRVQRGLWGTAPAPHGGDARVMSPVYIGSTAAAAVDANLNGAPLRNDPNFPLRYAVKVWLPEGYGWIARRIETTFGSQGYNTAWLDVSSCWQYNNSDPHGNPVAGWDDRNDTKLTSTAWGKAQAAKVAGLRRLLPGWRFLANSLLYRGNSCNNDLMSQHFDGGVLEHWLRMDGEFSNNWTLSMTQHLDIQRGNWPALYWVRWDLAPNAEIYKRFAYAAFLLGVEPGNNRYQFGGPFGLDRPDELFFWDWGLPTASAANVEDLRVGDTGLYRRDFANGSVFLNRGPATTVQLGQTMYDVTRTASGETPAEVTSVTVPTNDAVFLLREPTGQREGAPGSTPTTTTIVEPTTTTAPPATTTTTPNGGERAPETTMDPPTGRLRTSGVTLTGRATDDVGVERVQIAVQDPKTRRWLRSDGTWSSSFVNYELATVAPVGGPSVAWSWSWKPPARGTYIVQAVAIDAGWSHDRTAAWKKLTIR